MPKRIVTTQLITDTPMLKLPVSAATAKGGAITDSNFNVLRMTAKQALSVGVKRFKKDKALSNFNADIAVIKSVTKEYWVISVAVGNLVK